MEMCVQVLHSGVDGWGFPWCRGGSRCGSNEVWLEKVVVEQAPFLLERLRILAPPSNKKENLCDWGAFRAGKHTPERWKKAAVDKFAPNAVYTYAKKRKEKTAVHIWGCFAGKITSPLARMRGDPSSKRGGATSESMTYIRVLQENVKYMVKQFPVGTKVWFMQDGAGIHRGLVVQNWWRIVEEKGLCGREVELIDWPPYFSQPQPY